MLDISDIKIRNSYKKYITKHNIISKGTQAYCFKYKSDIVLKLVPKNIGFFVEFKSPEKVINSLSPFFLKINVIQSSKKFILYKQYYVDRIKDLGYSITDIYLVLTVVLTIIYMFKKNKLVTDIGIHNWGLYNGNIVIFDWHGMKSIKKIDTLARLIKNTNKYLSNYYSYLNVSESDIDKTLNTGNYIKIHDMFKEIYKTLYNKYYSQLSNTQIHILNVKLHKI